MSTVTLSLAFGPNPRSSPLLSGAIRPDGIQFVPTTATMPELAWRQLEYHQFDVSELSLSSLAIAISKGDDTFVGVPIFTTRAFWHTRILVTEASGIKSPEDLAGKRVGVPEYQQTAALWSRGALQHEYGVAPKDMKWFMERLPERSHGGATGFSPPPEIDFSYIPESTNIGEMMLAGELDATLLYIRGPNLVDRSSADLLHAPNIHPLFPDAISEGARYFSSTGIYPINHGVVIKREIAEKYPWAPVNIYKAFVEAKEESYRSAWGALEPFVECGVLPPTQLDAVDPLPYGMTATAKVLDTLYQYSWEQGLSARRMHIEEIFHPSTLHL